MVIEIRICRRLSSLILREEYFQTMCFEFYERDISSLLFAKMLENECVSLWGAVNWRYLNGVHRFCSAFKRLN